MTGLSQDLIWWISAIDIPAMAGLFWLIWRTRQDGNREIERLHNMLDQRSEQLREGLHAFKLEVAKNYASRRDLRLVESRIVGHLLRIEAKLDKTALEAASLRFDETRKR